MLKQIKKLSGLLTTLHSHSVAYSTPFNLNYIWSLGAMLGIILTTQIISGVELCMWYTSHLDYTFDSVEQITEDITFGWYIRYIHANGASLFFMLVYLHIAKALYYGSFQKPRQILWVSGVIIFLLMMATAFIGYVLPWGQMSLWGATVITNLFSAVPFIGDDLTFWLWGGYSVDEPLLRRFLALHFILPLILVALMLVHLSFLHESGSFNPLGLKKTVNINFDPYFVVKDFLAFLVTFSFLSFLLALFPNELGHPDNYIPADNNTTPLHIVPEWYFLPFYAMLRSVPEKGLGVVAMAGSLITLVFLPWIMPCFVKPIATSRFRLLYLVGLFFFILDVIWLGWVGQAYADLPFTWFAFWGTFYYFSFLLVFIPLLAIDFDFSTVDWEWTKIKF